MLRKHPRFQRESAPALLRRFCPHYHVKVLSDVDPGELAGAGMKGILLDLDNTLLPWKSHELPQETIDWVAKCQRAGLKLCLLSNTRNLARLQSISEKLNVPSVRARMKPAREGFRKALDVLGLAAQDVVMVGDQMFTDIWGGNRMGICTIWVERMHHREFFGTKISRLVEKLVMKILSKFRGEPS